MSPIKKILKYFFHHSFSGEMVDRVHQRLAEPGDEREKEEVLREIWNEIGFPEADKRSEMAFARLENTLDVRPRPCLRIPAWVRIAAIWLIPLLSLLAQMSLVAAVLLIIYIETHGMSGSSLLWSGSYLPASGSGSPCPMVARSG